MEVLYGPDGSGALLQHGGESLQQRVVTTLEVLVLLVTGVFAVLVVVFVGHQIPVDADREADTAKETAEQVKKNNEFLTSENAQLKKELKDLPALKAELTDIQMKLRLAEQQLIDAQREAEINLERSLAQLRVDYAKEFSVQERDFERKLANLEVELSKAAAISEARANQIEKIEKQHALEVEKLNDRLDGLRNKRQ